MILQWVNSSVDVQPNLDELREAVRTLDVAARRATSQQLVDDLRTTWRYNGAHAWNRLVCLCEALAEVRWGAMERLDAICLFATDGWDTSLINRQRDERLQRGWWGKRKAGWRPLTYRIYGSSDFPDAIPADYVRTIAPYNDEKAQCLFTQRNYQRQRPIGFPLYGGVNKVSEIVAALLRDLDQAMSETMRPDLYGEPLEHFHFSITCPFLDDEPNPRLGIGSFNAKTRSFCSHLYLSSDFARLAPREQREHLRSQLAHAIDAAEEKLKKRKLAYRFDLLRADVDQAFATSSPPWH